MHKILEAQKHLQKHYLPLKEKIPVTRYNLPQKVIFEAYFSIEIIDYFPRGEHHYALLIRENATFSN